MKTFLLGLAAPASCGWLRQGRGRVAAWSGALVFGAVAVGGCYPGDLLSVEDADIVVTAYDPSFDFSAASTWAMPDSVVPIAVDGAFNVYDHALDSTILATVAANMDALGYTRESDPDANGADLVVLVHANVSDSYPPFTPYAWDDTWDWYSGWSFWGGVSGYGSAYPWYVLPPGTDVADVPTGSIIIEIFDPNEPTSTSSGPGLPARWVAILNGLASVDSESRVTTAIDQAFDQSPYLGT